MQFADASFVLFELREVVVFARKVDAGRFCFVLVRFLFPVFVLFVVVLVVFLFLFFQQADALFFNEFLVFVGFEAERQLVKDIDEEDHHAGGDQGFDAVFEVGHECPEEDAAGTDSDHHAAEHAQDDDGADAFALQFVDEDFGAGIADDADHDADQDQSEDDQENS